MIIRHTSSVAIPAPCGRPSLVEDYKEVDTGILVTSRIWECGCGREEVRAEGHTERRRLACVDGQRGRPILVSVA